MNKDYPVFTESERQLIENFDKIPTAKKFGTLQAKQYFGKIQELQFLNLLKKEEGKKYIGEVWADFSNDVWFFKGIDGTTWRIPEPENGIDELFETEFKRVKDNEKAV